jgi:hypothetical protein
LFGHEHQGRWNGLHYTVLSFPGDSEISG